MNRAEISNPYSSLVKAYPNPSSTGNVTFETLDNVTISEFKLLNGVGQNVLLPTVFSGPNKIQLNTSKLSPGVYHASMLMNGKSISIQILISNIY
jgi:hypothetical protein